MPQEAPGPTDVVEARSISKSYRRYGSPGARLLEFFTGRPRHAAFEALASVSFRVPAGGGFGLIGENGAGKSTLLKILAGVTTPTDGAIRIEGTVASILELGAGFHPDFTGRQNVRLNAALFGLGGREIEERLPAIVEFSELGDFLDQPVKTYSTGMAMRLAFSIATQLEPAVLIIDEALSVGDGYFQKKCMDRLLRYREGGGTLLLCSHAMYYVSAFCESTLWLRNGRVAGLGPTEDVVRAYESFLDARSKVRSQNEAVSPVESAGPGRLRQVAIVGAAERLPHAPLEIEVEWESDSPDRPFHLGIGINRSDEIEVLSFSSARDGRSAFVGAHAHRALLRVPDLPMVKGDYTVYVFLLDERALNIYDRRILPSALSIRDESYHFGMVEAEHQWLVEAAPRIGRG